MSLPNEPALQISRLNKIYAGDVRALNAVDITVEQGDFFALLGPNGAGKSTTIGIIASLVKKTSGQVKVFGHDLDTENNRVKQCIGLVPQEFNCNIFESCLQIITDQAGYYGIPRTIAKQRAEELLQQLGLWEKRHEIGQRLSGGMKRRLMIARALVHQPKLLILDEPTAGVDVELRHFMWEFLQTLNEQGTTIILTTHYLEEAEALCRNIVIINRGDVVIDTDKQTLLGKLHQETYLFDCREPWQMLPEIAGVITEALDASTLAVQIPKGHSISQVVNALYQLGTDVIHIRLKTNPLEELFLHLTATKAGES